MNILVIDDEHEMRRLIIDTLKAAGYDHFEEADSGLTGARLTENADLILTDLHMPGMSGGSLIREIRSNRYTENTPIIAITSDNDEVMVHRILREGVQDYIVKPFKTELLIEKVNRIRDDLIHRGVITG